MGMGGHFDPEELDAAMQEVGLSQTALAGAVRDAPTTVLSWQDVIPAMTFCGWGRVEALGRPAVPSRPSLWGAVWFASGPPRPFIFSPASVNLSEGLR